MISKDELLVALNDPEVIALLHRLSDSDIGPRSQHHTLGKRLNQAAPGTHLHDGNDSRQFTDLTIKGTLKVLGSLQDKAAHPYIRWAGIQRNMTGASTVINTDANGEQTITHGLQDQDGNAVTPIVVMAQGSLGTVEYVIQTGTYTSTTFGVRMFIANTAARAANLSGYPLRWIAIG